MVVVAGLADPGRVGATEADGQIVLASETFKYVISTGGRNVAFIDTATGEDYLKNGPSVSVARAKVGDQWHDAESARADGDDIALTFSGTSATAALSATRHPRHVVVEVVWASEEIEELQLLNIELTLGGSLNEPFAACALALNLQTNVHEIPGPNSRLAATCYRRFGLEGAVVAIVASPTQEMRDVLKEAVAASETLPQSPLGGPWAMDARINRASYLFAAPTEENVDEIIRTLRSIGFNQVQIHGGRNTFRFGDCKPNPDLYPDGVASIRAVVDRLRDAGIHVGMQPYSFFIDKSSPWVTPVPDPGLASSATFTLAEDLSADATAVPVLESTEAMSTITGFFERNSVTLRIGEELITYSGLSKELPYAFTGCTRGALGTTAAAHPAGTEVHHLEERFGLFAPDPYSPLFTEVVGANARFFNEAGFDTIYLDALDGGDVLGGEEWAWHYNSKFVWELWKRLDRPAAVEYSTFHHHLWFLRSRHGAWDYPTRAYMQFIDQHVAANRRNDAIFLPSNLGWWAFHGWQPPQVEPTFPDDIEYWCAKALGTGSGLSLLGYDPDRPAHQRLAAIVRNYETLRHDGYFSEEVKARLREPGAEFALEQTSAGQWQFRPVNAVQHRVRSIDGWSNRWTVPNPYEAQAPSLRIEALMAAGPYDANDNITVAAFQDDEEFPERAAAPGVTADLQPMVRDGAAYGRLTATNTRPERQGTWASFRKTFDPPLNLTGHQGLGVWVRGDGKGQVLNFQLRSPTHLSPAYGERYVVVDFEGWRYFELIELDADRYRDYTWPYPGGYPMYRELIRPEAIETLTIWCNNLPPDDSIQVDFRPVLALPLVPSRLSKPRLTIGGAIVEFHVEFESGAYLEIGPDGRGQLYGANGQSLADVTAPHDLPRLVPGDNTVEFTCERPAPPASRARVTLFTRGQPFQ
jgi:hypothetical protein